MRWRCLRGVPALLARGTGAWGAVLLSAWIGCWTAVPARAAEAEASGDKPSLLSVDVATTIASLAVFVLLLFVLTKTAWKPILAGLRQREETIRKALDEAAEASTKARTLVAEYEQRLAKAADEAQAIVEGGRKDGEELRARIEKDAQRSAEETMARAHREIEHAARKAYDDVLRDVAGIATEVAGRIVRERLTPEGHVRLVDDVVRDFAASRGRGAGKAG
jgi:F-type H+-transporting ATPase subunit b